MKRLPLVLIAITTIATFSSTRAQIADVTWQTGTFTDNSVLSTYISLSDVGYAVDIGSTETFVTANGYTFFADDQTWITSTGGSLNAADFVGGGAGTSTDVSFNTVLGSALIGPAGGLYTLNNLIIGETYELLLLRTDTRALPEVPGRSYDAIGGTNTSPEQIYAFGDGGATLGGFIYGTFTATATTQQITVGGGQDGGMLNALVLGGQVTPIPEPSSLALLAMGSGAGMLLFLRKRRSNAAVG